MWSMPRSLLKIVAGVLAACALTGLVLGFQGAPRKGRLPGESVKGESAEALNATDVTPFVEDAPPPPPEEKAPEEVKKDEVDPAEGLPPDATAVQPTAPVKPAVEDKVGEILEGATPPPQDDPPH